MISPTREMQIWNLLEGTFPLLRLLSAQTDRRAFENIKDVYLNTCIR